MNIVPNQVWYFIGFDPKDPSDWVNMSMISEDVVLNLIEELKL